MRWATLAAFLTGCTAKPPSVSDLAFPVAVFFGRSSVVLFNDPTALGTMQIGNLNAVTEPPPLIDSTFAVYTLAKLASTHNGLWLMAHPTGSTPVTFALERGRSSGIDAARTLLGQRLDEQTWRTDLDEARRGLANEQNLVRMVALVKGG